MRLNAEQLKAALGFTNRHAAETDGAYGPMGSLLGKERREYLFSICRDEVLWAAGQGHDYLQTPTLAVERLRPGILDAYRRERKPGLIGTLILNMILSAVAGAIIRWLIGRIFTEAVLKVN